MGAGRVHCFSGGRLAVRVGAQSGDSVEQLAAMPECRDAKLLQVLSRQVRQDRFVNLVLAEGPLVSFEAKAPQPGSEVHNAPLRLAGVLRGAHQQG